MEKLKLKEVKNEYDNIMKKLGAPEVFCDVKELKVLNKKKSELEIILNKYEKLTRLKKAINQNNKIISEEKDKELISLALSENEKLSRDKKAVEEEIEFLFSKKNEIGKKDVIVEIRAGAGGDEAGLFASELFRMYVKFAENENWNVSVLSSNKTTIGGFKEIIFEINGGDVYSKMKYESGVHRVQRIPKTEKQGRIHTSTATVAVLPKAEEKEIDIKKEDVKIDVFRSSGPGGQSVNTTDSAVRITHLPTNITVSCQDEKSQLKNRERAMRILRTRLLSLEEEKRERKEKNTRRSQIGTGDRSEKIRTYNFPQDRITDHRVKKSWYDIEKVLDGNINNIIEFLRKNLE